MPRATSAIIRRAFAALSLSRLRQSEGHRREGVLLRGGLFVCSTETPHDRRRLGVEFVSRNPLPSPNAYCLLPLCDASHEVSTVFSGRSGKARSEKPRVRSRNLARIRQLLTSGFHV